MLHLILALLGGIVGGAIWGGTVGFLKARTGAHEVIVTIMMNYIALYFLSWLITQKGVQDPTRTDAISKTDPRAARRCRRSSARSLSANLGLILGLAAVVGIGWLLSRSTFGFELRAVGANPNAARTAGMSVGRTYTLAMLIAGALAGLGGATILLGTAHQLTGAVVGNIGFDGITVALLGRGKPWGVVWAALLFGGVQRGRQPDAVLHRRDRRLRQRAPGRDRHLHRRAEADRVDVPAPAGSAPPRSSTNLAKGW